MNRTFEPCSKVIDGTVVTGYKITCASKNCDNEETITVQNQWARQPEKIIKMFKQKGWQVGNRPNGDICTACQRSGKRHSEIENTAAAPLIQASLTTPSPFKAEAVSQPKVSTEASKVSPAPSSGLNPPADVPPLGSKTAEKSSASATGESGKGETSKGAASAMAQAAKSASAILRAKEPTPLSKAQAAPAPETPVTAAKTLLSKSESPAAAMPTTNAKPVNKTHLHSIAPESNGMREPANRIPTIDENNRILNMTRQNYSDPLHGYKPGWSDKKIAAEIGVPVEWVIETRARFCGPEFGSLPDINEILADIVTHQGNYASLRTQHDMLLSDIEAQKAQLEKLIADSDELALLVRAEQEDLISKTAELKEIGERIIAATGAKSA